MEESDDSEDRAILYFSVVIKQGTKLLLSSIIKCKYGETVSDMVSRLIVEDNNPIHSVHCGEHKDRATTEIELSTPFHVIRSFGCKYVEIQVRAPESAQRTPARTIFDVMTTMAAAKTHLPPKKPEHRGDNKVYNKLIDVLKERKVGFSNQTVSSTGVKVVDTLAKALWYLDYHHDKFRSRSIEIPAPFCEFSGFYCHDKTHKKVPQLQASDLKGHMDNIAELLMLPWLQHKDFADFKLRVEGLLNCMEKYRDFLLQQQERNKAAHHDTGKGSAVCHPLGKNTSRRIAAVDVMDRSYDDVHSALSELDPYQPLCLLEYEPEDRFDRRKWFNKFGLTFATELYQHHYGNYIGNLSFVWKLPDYDSDVADSLKAILHAKDMVPVYANRAARQQFIERYAKSSGAQPALLRDAFRFLTGDCSAAESSHQADVDQRVAEFLLLSGDSELFQDMRANNGRPKDPKFDPFWDALAKHLDDSCVVDERRDGAIAYMPLAISVQDLCNQVVATLPEGTPVPSSSWVRFNFWPSNPYTRNAMQYTGRFNVRFKVQQRLLRAQHVDAKYVACQFKLMKSMAVRYRDFSTFICVDDKAIVPVGEPERHLSTGVRAHNSAPVAGGAAPLLALDHDFHVCGVVPSVLFKVDIPSEDSGSFYSGEVHVTLKDKVFEPSSGARHAAEMTNILRKSVSEDGVNLDTPVLFLFSDGGPDHRTTYKSVQIASVAVFLALDLDMLITARTAPCQSYMNPAERIMSLLNLGLQHVSTARPKMKSDAHERRMSNLNCLSRVRNESERDEDFKTDLKESVKCVIDIIDERFSRLQWKEQQLTTHPPATDDEIDEVLELVKLIDDDVDFSRLQAKDVARYKKLVSFMKSHCQERTYTFQVKKCANPECAICSICGPRLPPDIFEELRFLPDPVVDETTEKFRTFEETYGTVTSEKACPSIIAKPKPTEHDMKNRSLLVAAKVRQFIYCAACGKRRVIYSRVKLTRPQETMLIRIKEELIYTCGDALLTEDHPLFDAIITREGLTCGSPIEIPYYSGQSFLDICYHCGNEEVAQTDGILKLQEEWGIVRPICMGCLDKGLQPSTRSAIQVGKKQKRN